MSILPEKHGIDNHKEEEQDQVTYRGLCATCVLAPNCTFPRDPARPVLHCDEFLGQETPPTRTARQVLKPVSGDSRSATEKADDSGELVGLCKNCEDREHCTFPKPQGGVWHCDEYR